MDRLKIIDKLKKIMTIDGVLHKRFNHSLEVYKMADRLNKTLNLKLNDDKVFLAAILHDAAKLKSKEELKLVLKNNLDLDMYLNLLPFPQTWHSFAGKFVVNAEFGIDDEEILSAIYYHTTGRPKMTLLEKLIFVSDYIEETRVGTHFDVARKACLNNLDEGLKIILTQMVDYFKKSGTIIYDLTIKTYNYYVGIGEEC